MELWLILILTCLLIIGIYSAFTPNYYKTRELKKSDMMTNQLEPEISQNIYKLSDVYEMSNLQLKNLLNDQYKSIQRLTMECNVLTEENKQLKKRIKKLGGGCE